MNQICIMDSTLCQAGNHYTFREKLEIARQLERAKVDVIELPEIEHEKSDILLVRTVASFAKNAVISVAAGLTLKSVALAAEALSSAKKPSIRIELPVSPVNMEYVCHRKPAKMLEWIDKIVTAAAEKCPDVGFTMLDATRAEESFLYDAIDTAVKAGATHIELCDNAGRELPDDFADFVKKIAERTTVPVGVSVDNQNSLSAAAALLALRKGASAVKTSVGGKFTDLNTLANFIKNNGDSYGLSTRLRYTELAHIVQQISWITDGAENEIHPLVARITEEGIHLDENDDKKTVIQAVKSLGYDLSKDDEKAVYEEFARAVVKKKIIGTKELDAIVVSTALQVPPTYKLISYFINSGNTISASAQITLEKDGKQSKGISIGNGPIDASFLALEQILGHHYELDDFQIQTVTEGREAMGSALVKIRSGGKLYSGTGISTDIIGASIRAYINAINKIVYEEE